MLVHLARSRRLRTNDNNLPGLEHSPCIPEQTQKRQNLNFHPLPSTKTAFLCAFGVWNPRFRPFRAQNRGFCAFFASETPVFEPFEHKIEVFVLFLPSEPLFSGLSSTKSRFLCFFCLRNPCFRSFRAQNWHFCAREEGHVAAGSVRVTFQKITAHVSKTQMPHNQIINFYQRAR